MKIDIIDQIAYYMKVEEGTTENLHYHIHIGVSFVGSLDDSILRIACNYIFNYRTYSSPKTSAFLIFPN